MSDITDQAELRRRKMIEYNVALADFRHELQEQNAKKKDRILQLAKILEEAGHNKEKISAQVSHDLKAQVDSSWVRKILGDENKDKKHANKESVINHAAEQKKLLVAASGQTSTEDQEEGDEENNPLDEIYSGNSLEQMRKEANNDTHEDKEETLKSPVNRISNPIPIILDKSPKEKNYETEIEGLKKALEYQKELASNAIEQHKKISWIDKRLINENTELKTKINNLQTILYESNEEVRKDQAFKEIEILKLDKLRDGQIRMLSAKSQKTLFLWVNPKTMEIIDIKTDTEQHRITELRRGEKPAPSSSDGVVSGAV